MQESQSKISNVEWGLVIGALFGIDLIQIIIEWILIWIGIGIAINWFIDIMVGLSFALYLHTRGERMTDPKRAFGLIGTFLLELIPGIDELPLWGLDGIYAMSLAKRKSIKNTLSPQIKLEENREKQSTDDDMPMAA